MIIINKRNLFFLISVWLLSTLLSAQNVTISTPHTQLLLSVPNGGTPEQLYYGSRTSDADIRSICETARRRNAYPVYGMGYPCETALSVRHADGNLTLQMAVIGVKETRLTKENATLTVIELKDKVYPFFVNICYKAWQDADVIETWTEIRHEEKKPVQLQQFASAYLPVRRGNVWLSHLSGAWANEGQLCQEALQPGMKVIKNTDGVRNSQSAHAEVMFSLDGKPQENTGRVIGAALCYSGNYKLRIDTQEDDWHHFLAGINEENSCYNLKKEEVFRTPALALTYSDEGMSGCSRKFHQWARLHKLANGNTPRKILLNSWEGVYFDINEQGMDQMMGDIAAMGGELFVMDDGWFGDKYPRKNDSYALGDWTVDKTKLPGGLQSLLDNARKHGIRFGIWLEPEMANTKSELYEKHPEWIIKAPEREVVCARGGTQVVLDLSNPQVQDFIVQTVDELMNSYPDIDYIKWDANMSIITQGSQYLTKDNQSHLNIEYHRGFENVCRRIRASYPQLTIQACASGGGRVNYGVLPYFDEFWTSDNTDALQRIYIQWGTSYFFPAIGMGAHISASPNHQTSRSVPLKFRIDVAMSGRLGMEIQPKNMTEEEKALCRNAIAEYKTIRPVVQFGDIYRLLSPYDKQGAASLMYVSPEKDKAVFYWWKTEHFCNRHLPRVKMAGLAPDKYYKVHELNRIDTEPLKFEGKSFSGAYLNDNGLEIPSTHRVEPSKQNEYASRVLYLEEVTPSFSDNRIEQRPPLRVLCLGNSITRHEYKADIEWFSEWGMAASKEENDYCHQLEKMLSQNRPGTVVTPLNIAYWERNLNCNIDSLIGTHVTDKDVIVIRLGENVQDKEAFKSGILRLVEYCKRKADKVVITGCFWKDEEKERAIINAAHMHGLTFIPIDWIDRLYNSRPKVGDTLYDIHGKPYTVTKDFIIAHPDDEGMKKIAEAIYRVL